MSRRTVPLLLEDIWEAVEKIERYVSGLNHDAFVKDDKTIDSVVRNLEIIGEAANRLPKDFKAQHSEVERPKIVGLRHRIVHDYFSIDVEIVWEIIQRICRFSNRSFHGSANDQQERIDAFLCLYGTAIRHKQLRAVAGALGTIPRDLTPEKLRR